jgi:hypothetical protein
MNAVDDSGRPFQFGDELFCQASRSPGARELIVLRTEGLLDIKIDRR